MENGAPTGTFGMMETSNSFEPGSQGRKPRMLGRTTPSGLFGQRTLLWGY
jgi:hypothetical protein